MKNIERIAVILIILFFVSIVMNTMVKHMVYFLDKTFHLTKSQIGLLSIVMPILLHIINIVIAIWLFRTAKELKCNPWTWALFGFAFSISGAILFYVVRIYEEIKIRNNSDVLLTEKIE
jgi:uncharacterized BrkB/YihY/UPF0761 family membrane protein